MPAPDVKTTSLLLLLALVAGALIPVQAAANAALSKSIQGNVPFSALALFVVAGVVTALAVLVSRDSIPAAADLRAAPWWSYIGGLIVAFYVFSITFLAPRLACRHRDLASGHRPDSRRAHHRPFRPAPLSHLPAHPNPTARRGADGHRRLP